MNIKGIFIKILPDRLWKALRVFFRPSYYMNLETITYNQDGLVTQHSADFMDDPLFAESYELGEATNSWNGWPTHWRSHVACWAAHKVISLEGDFVECGVNKGAIARMLINYVQFDNYIDKTFYLLDTYEGIDTSQLSDKELEYNRHKTKYLDTYDEVLNTFKEFDNVKIIKGLVPVSLSQVKSKKVAFLSLDMNVAEPEIAAAEFFWEKMVSGGVILLDDYGWKGHSTQKYAFDNFSKEKGVPLLCMPTGQGVIIKP